MYEVFDCSNGNVCPKGELTVLLPRFLRTDKGLDPDDLLQVLLVVPNLLLKFPALNGTPKQGLKKDGHVFARPQVVSPRVVISSDKGTSADSLEPLYLGFNEFEFFSGLPVIGPG